LAFNWTQLIPGVDPSNTHVATTAVSGVVLVGAALVARAALGKGDKALEPADRFSIRGIFEVISEFIVSLTDMVVGDHGRKFAPMFATIFFFILVNNLLGLVPGMSPATMNINTTVAIGLFTFVAYHIYGLKEHKGQYVKQFLGPIWWLAWLMLPIELISHVVRPFSLGLRLQGNIQGDETVLHIFLELLPPHLRWIPIPAIFYCIGIFVCFMQAFVFTMMSMIYVSLAVSHDH
jgi:F-type H+-transporting ATPase subunit a